MSQRLDHPPGWREEDETVFDTPDPLASLPPPLARRKTLVNRSKSFSIHSETEINDVELEANLLWKGAWDVSEVHFAKTKDEDVKAHMRWAQVLFIKYWLSGDDKLANEVIERFDSAERACLKDIKAQEVSIPFPRRRFRRSMSRGKLLMRDMNEDEKPALRQWKELQGMAALCSLFKGIVQVIEKRNFQASKTLMNTWKIVKTATDNVEDAVQKPVLLALVTAILQLSVSVMPESLIRTFNELGLNAEEGEGTLEALSKDATGETLHYTHLALSIHALVISTREFRLDRAGLLKRAEARLAVVLRAHPDWVLYRWMHSQVLRHMGCLNEATLVARGLTFQIQNQLSDVSRRLSFDHATLLFMQRDWKNCREALEGLESIGESQRGLVQVMLSAVLAHLDGEDWVKPLSLVPKRSEWYRRLEVLRKRPNPTLLYYEIVYIRGMLAWVNNDVAGSLKKGGGESSFQWLKLAETELTRIMLEDETFVMFKDKQDSYMENLVVQSAQAKEELVFIRLLLGKVEGMKGEYTEARKHLSLAITLAKPGTWHAPFARYELANLDILEGNWISAKDNLRYDWYQPYSFASLLRFRVRGALHYISTHNSYIVPSSAQIENDSMTAVTVEPNIKYTITRYMNSLQAIQWKTTVEHQSIPFQVFFVTAASGNAEEVHESEMIETGDESSGEYTSTVPGTLHFVWDNTKSPYTVRNIRYMVTYHSGRY